MNWGLLQNSFIVAAGSTLLASLWGLTVALFAGTLGKKARSALLLLSVATFALPPFMTANLWLHYFGLMGPLRPYFPFELFSLPGTILLIALQLWPVVFLFCFAGILRVDRLYFEFDPALGGQRFVSVVLWPAIKPALWHGAAVSFVLALNNFAIPALLQTKVYAAEVWLSFNTHFDYLEALRLSWPLVLGPLLLLAAVRRRELRLAFRSAEFPAHLFHEKLGTMVWPSGLIAGKILSVAVLIPLLDLLLSSRTWAELLPAIAAGHAATLNSLLFALLPGLLLVCLGTIFADRKWPFAFWIVFLMPGVLSGIALIWLFNRPATSVFYGGAGIVVFAYVLRFLAPAWMGGRLAADSADRAPLDVVRSFGGSRWMQLRFAQWPQSRQMLLATFALIYLMCLWEVETLILIVPPGRETLALRIFNMLHYGHAGQVNALCLWMLCLALAPLVLAWAGRKLLHLTVAVLLLAAAGCGPGAANPNARPLKSEIFSSVEVIGTRGTGAGQFNKPRSLALDRDDNLYVVDLTGRVQKFDRAGKFVLAWEMPQTDKGKPKGMVQDPDGNVVVIEPHYSRINYFDPQGRLLTQWGVNGTNIGQLTFPRSAAFNSHGEIYLSEYGMMERVLHFTQKGEKFLGVIGQGGTENGDFNRAEGLGVGPDDRLYVADSCNHRIQIFSPEGKWLESFGKPGSGVGELSYPYDVRVDSTGLRFVCEFGNSRLQIFDPQNRTVEIVGEAGGEPGQLFNPWAMALDSQGNLFVADSGNHRVQKFNRRHPLEKPVRNTGAGGKKETVASATK